MPSLPVTRQLITLDSSSVMKGIRFAAIKIQKIAVKECGVLIIIEQEPHSSQLDGIPLCDGSGFPQKMHVKRKNASKIFAVTKFLRTFATLSRK